MRRLAEVILRQDDPPLQIFKVVLLVHISLGRVFNHVNLPLLRWLQVPSLEGRLGQWPMFRMMTPKSVVQSK